MQRKTSMQRVSNLLHLHFNLEYENRTLKEINVHLILVNNVTWKIFIKVFLKMKDRFKNLSDNLIGLIPNSMTNREIKY